MMFPSHLLGALLVGGLLSRVRPFRPRDWQLALAFAVAIDLDHLVQIPAYVASHGVAGATPAAMLRWGDSWQGFMHDALWGSLATLGAAVFFRSLVPVGFWLLHMLQDFVIATDYVVFGSLAEWIVIGALALAVGFVFAHDHRANGAGRAFHHHVAWRFGLPHRGLRGDAVDPAPPAE